MTRIHAQDVDSISERMPRSVSYVVNGQHAEIFNQNISRVTWYPFFISVAIMLLGFFRGDEAAMFFFSSRDLYSTCIVGLAAVDAGEKYSTRR
jgi:hypothetical protein